MNSILDMIELQKIDSQLAEIEELLGDLPIKVADLQNTEDNLISDFERGKARLKEIAVELHKTEMNLIEFKEKIDKLKDQLFLVTNNKHIKTILDNSPNIFGVGDLKYRFFKSFMRKNVGVSNCPFIEKKNGCPWKMRRQINERALNTNKLHIYASKYNQDIRKSLLKLNDKSIFTYNDFIKFGKLFTSQIVFNTNKPQKG